MITCSFRYRTENAYTLDPRALCTTLDAGTEDYIPCSDDEWRRSSLAIMNQVNALAYRDPKTFEHVPAFFSRNSVLNFSIGEFIRKNQISESFSMLEIGSGESFHKWEFILSGCMLNHSVSVILGDFYYSNGESDQPLTPRAELNANVRLSFRNVNLLDSFEYLPPQNRYDWILSTYTFDSVFLPQDVIYFKKGTHWFEVRYTLPPGMIDQIDPSIIFKEIDITQKPFGETIRQSFDSVENAMISIPGGLIAKVIEASQKILSPGGSMLIGDIGSSEDCTHDREPLEILSNTRARFKVDFYPILRAALCPLGFKVAIYPVSDFIDQNFNQKLFNQQFPDIVEVDRKVERSKKAARTFIVHIQAPQ